ncbi:RNA polymerase sigma24 factor [Kineosporia sp. NBRC 101677]|uniref:RNA polymerase sigma factor n=1 Tax=Kineosporia TaxID=49184 RepID=UPI000A7EF146|nr:RNA polymerase sigma24 factor [Kineosporia sp. NBRC 101677]
MKREPFESVVERHGPTVLRVCRAVVGPVAADDAWSETFLAALQAYPGLQPDSNVEAWLVTIAHRKAVDQLRHLSRGPVPVAQAHAGNDPPEHPEPVDEVALGQALAQGLDGALASLPHQADALDPWPAVLALPLRQRQAVAYHHVAGLPYADVAALLNCSVVAARRAASDGIAALRSILQPQETS